MPTVNANSPSFQEASCLHGEPCLGGEEDPTPRAEYDIGLGGLTLRPVVVDITAIDLFLQSGAPSVKIPNQWEVSDIEWIRKGLIRTIKLVVQASTLHV